MAPHCVRDHRFRCATSASVASCRSLAFVVHRESGTLDDQLDGVASSLHEGLERLGVCCLSSGVPCCCPYASSCDTFASRCTMCFHFDFSRIILLKCGMCQAQRDNMLVMRFTWMGGKEAHSSLSKVPISNQVLLSYSSSIVVTECSCHLFYSSTRNSLAGILR